MDTALWQVRDALVTVFTGAVDASTKVYPGPRPKGDNPKRYVLVSSDGGDTGIGEATDEGMTASQEPSDLGHGMWRDESGTVVCSVWAWTGNTSFTSSEATAREIFGQCAGAVAADRSLGGLLVLPGLAEVESLSIRESLISNSPTVRIAFSVNYGALITT